MENDQISKISFEMIKADANALTKKMNEAKELNTNKFPYDVFPTKVQDIILATNSCLNFPIDFIGASMLFAASVAIGNTHKVEIKKGHQETSVIYLAIVAPAGTNKSHPLSFAVKPLNDNDSKSYDKYKHLKKEYEQAVKSTNKNIDKQSINDPEKPALQKLLLSDYTPEALAEVHKNNKRGIGVYVDELASWFKNFNRYNKGSETEFWLSAWSSKPIDISRKSSEPIHISNPFISVAGTMQKGILSELAKDNRTQNGFIDRILFVIFDNLKKECWNEEEIDPIHAANWQEIILNLLALPLALDDFSNPNPQILRLSNEARERLFEWQKENTDQCNIANEKDNEAIGSILSKMDMYVARLALILELIFWACGESNKQEISLKSIEGAIKLIEYFKISAIKVNSIITGYCPLDRLPEKKQALYKNLPDTFSTADGLMVALDHEITERTYNRMIDDKKLFARTQRGFYKKII